jgi:3',5'-cyclic AMP phosphodiesterase CpdA
MQPPVTFIHLTDVHIGRPDDTHLHSDTTENLRRAIAEIARIEPRPAFAIVSGDLANAGDPESYAALKAELDKLRMPVLCAIGNHDTREGFYRGFMGRTESLTDPYDHDVLVAGVHVITLDSSIPGAIGGDLDEAQFSWLADALQRHPDAARLIVIHHPPALDDHASDTPWRMLPVSTSQRLAAMLAGQRVAGILSGHIHHDRFSQWHGMPLIVGNGLHAATDILDPEFLRMVRAASFGLGTLRASGLTMAVVPLPSDRAELARYPLAALRARALAAAE